ncbi:hypothetical protein D1AOALGA4SA_4206 [Olavius algarvensis Delta 1 endosymbiont]|nr:hypothetical protein D1AOALGA4SA_4206 [Olavius algarvensis Delta 1 endosymbiont]
MEQHYDFVRYCPVCEGPCTGSYTFKFTLNKDSYVFDIDSHSIDAIFEMQMEKHTGEYHDLPKTVREWNEMTGWRDEDSGTYLDIDEFIKCLDSNESDLNRKDFVAILIRFLRFAKSNNEEITVELW